MSEELTRYEQMRQAAQQFHCDHPEVWDLFVRFTFELIHRGFEHYSARAVFHRIRWETAEARGVDSNEFKIGNNHSPFYARRFMRMYPEYGPSEDDEGNRIQGFFRIREQISKRKDAINGSELGPDDYPYTFEEADQTPLFEETI